MKTITLLFLLFACCSVSAILYFYDAARTKQTDTHTVWIQAPKHVTVTIQPQPNLETDKGRLAIKKP